MAEFKCPNCKDTGATHEGGYLDCAAPGCTAAVERAALEEWAVRQTRNTLDLIWAVHQRATALAEKACEERFAAQQAIVQLPDDRA